MVDGSVASPLNPGLVFEPTHTHRFFCGPNVLSPVEGLLYWGLATAAAQVLSAAVSRASRVGVQPLQLQLHLLHQDGGCQLQALSPATTPHVARTVEVDRLKFCQDLCYFVCLSLFCSLRCKARVWLMLFC